METLEAGNTPHSGSSKRFIQVKRPLIFIIAMTCTTVLLVGQEDSKSLSYTSFDVRTGFAFGLGGSEPGLSWGFGVQRLDKGWLYSAELSRQNAEAFRAYLADEPQKDKLWNLNAMMGRRITLGEENLCKMTFSTGLGLQLAKRTMHAEGGHSFATESRIDVGIALPIRLDLTWGKKDVGGGFYFYGNINTDASHYGAGIVVPIYTKY